LTVVSPERLADSKTIKIDIRIIAATHRNLKQMVENGDFREDLFYRLSVFPLTLPALRERKNDISLLVHYFVNKYATKMSKQISSISETIMEKLLYYPWPGNVRELENVIERAIILSPKKSLLIPELLIAAKNNTSSATDQLLPLTELEKTHIIKVLKTTDWKISGEEGATSILEIHPNTLRSRMSKLGIRRSNNTL